MFDFHLNLTIKRYKYIMYKNNYRFEIHVPKIVLSYHVIVKFFVQIAIDLNRM